MTEEPKGDMLEGPEAGFDDSSFFSTVASNRPRQFKEIVSSVQGNFDFLQESQIDIESKSVSMLSRPRLVRFIAAVVIMVYIPVDTSCLITIYFYKTFSLTLLYWHVETRQTDGSAMEKIQKLINQSMVCKHKLIAQTTSNLYYFACT